jgi:hypothetical protein
MKIRLIIPGIFLSVALVSLTNRKPHLPNANSWSISIGEKELLASWLDNEMGDTITLKKSDLNRTDNLVAKRYLCGQSAEGLLVTVTLKNSKGETIAESENMNEFLMFSGSLRVSEIMDSPRIKSGDVVGVYFEIRTISDQQDYPVLLGNLKLE